MPSPICKTELSFSAFKRSDIKQMSLLLGSFDVTCYILIRDFSICSEFHCLVLIFHPRLFHSFHFYICEKEFDERLVGILSNDHDAGF